MDAPTAPTWNEVKIGMEVGPISYRVDAAAVGAYAAALPIAADPYLEAGVMPPMQTASNYILLLRGRLHLGFGLMTRHTAKCHRAFPVGERATATGRLVEKFEKKGRHYWTLEYEVRDDAGALFETHRLTATVD